MADVGRRYAGLVIDLRLEWKQAQHFVDAALDAVDALAAPCPQRRTYVVHGRDATCTQRTLESQIEVRCVHTDEQIRRIGDHAPPHVVADTNDARNLTQHFDIAAYRKRFSRIPRLESGALHLRPADAHETRGRQMRLQRPHEMRAEQIAGRLACHHGDAQLTACSGFHPTCLFVAYSSSGA